MKLLLSIAVGLLLSSCQPSKNSVAPYEEKDSPPVDAATISASPNPVPAGNPLGATTISWSTGSLETGEVYVNKHKNGEKLFATGPAGSKEVRWIAPHIRYEFRLYEGKAHDKVLAKVRVTQKP